MLSVRHVNRMCLSGSGFDVELERPWDAVGMDKAVELIKEVSKPTRASRFTRVEGLARLFDLTWLFWRGPPKSIQTMEKMLKIGKGNLYTVVRRGWGRGYFFNAKIC